MEMREQVSLIDDVLDQFAYSDDMAQKLIDYEIMTVMKKLQLTLFESNSRGFHLFPINFDTWSQLNFIRNVLLELEFEVLIFFHFLSLISDRYCMTIRLRFTSRR